MTMSLRHHYIASSLFLFVSLPVAAQNPADPEALARPRDGESASLELDTIRKYGDVMARFEVTIAWADSARPAPSDYGARRVRYMANCEEGTMALAAVALFDRSGALQKTMVVPPGGSDPVKPEKGSDAYKWLRRVCMF
jgi:hypothetical protein